MKLSKILVLGGLIGLIAAFFALGLHHYLTLSYIKSQQAAYQAYYEDAAALTILAYSAVYIVLTAVAFPGAAVLTLLAGALFGPWLGTAIVSVASTIGATLSFLIARYVLRSSVEQKFGERMRQFNEGIRKDGAFYLFTLRLIPVVPFFMINVVMGLTPMRVWQYFIVSQIGMLPGTFVYVNAGTQLSQIDSLAGIVSPSVLLSFALLGIFPILAKKGLEFLKARKVYARWAGRKPKSFEYNVIAIGGGAAGLVTSYISAAAQARVALIEARKMGGDCLNTGCVPSKALIRTAKFVHDMNQAHELGVKDVNFRFDFKDVMKRVHAKIAQIEPHDSVERYTSLGVECISGYAKILSPWEVEVNGRVLTTRNIVLATGAQPILPSLEGLAQMEPLTSENLWELNELPKTLLVLGGGPIGCEMAQAFARLGSKVVQVEQSDRLMSGEDLEVSEFVHKKFKNEGVEVLVKHKALRFQSEGSSRVCIVEHAGAQKRIAFDRVLVAVGRRANVKGFGLENLGIEVDASGRIKVDEYLRTNIPNIYACGDCMSPLQFTHVASHQAWFAAVNSMLAPWYGFKADYRFIPRCTFTDPEVARVGLNEQEAKGKQVPFEVTLYGIDDLDRAIVDNADEGFIKVLTAPGKDKILGVTIVGHGAGEFISEYVTAFKYGLGLNKILATPHIYPSYSETNKYAAGNWKRHHVNPKALKFAQKFNRWRRRGR